MKKLLIAGFFLLAPTAAFAHPTMASIEKTADGYFFDIGYSADFIAGDFIRLDLAIADETTREIIPFSSAWVRIRQGESVLFAGPIAYGEFGRPGFSYVFPREGDYLLSIRFESATSTMAEEDFPIKVAPPADGEGSYQWAGWTVFLIIGAVAGYFIGSKFKKHA